MYKIHRGLTVNSRAKHVCSGLVAFWANRVVSHCNIGMRKLLRFDSNQNGSQGWEEPTSGIPPSGQMFQADLGWPYDILWGVPPTIHRLAFYKTNR